VTGDVNDPKFDFNEIIQQALGSAITSVITAPFSFLASLVGADSADLGQVEFLEGSAVLLPPQRERIAKLRKALNQRPALVIELAGPFNRTFDSPALRRKKAIDVLRHSLAEVGREVIEPSLTNESNQDILEELLNVYYPEVNLELVQARFTEKQNMSSDATKLDALAYRSHLAKRITAAQLITNADLKAIANARASAARDALITPNEDDRIAGNRVRIVAPKELDLVGGERIAMEATITVD
jgi:hypothetical protein